MVGASNVRTHLSFALVCFYCLFLNGTATTEIYTLSLHDALPISSGVSEVTSIRAVSPFETSISCSPPDRKSTRLNSSHSQISYAVFCLKKKNTSNRNPSRPQRRTIQSTQ